MRAGSSAIPAHHTTEGTHSAAVHEQQGRINRRTSRLARSRSAFSAAVRRMVVCSCGRLRCCCCGWARVGDPAEPEDPAAAPALAARDGEPREGDEPEVEMEAVTCSCSRALSARMRSTCQDTQRISRAESESRRYHEARHGNAFAERNDRGPIRICKARSMSKTRASTSNRCNTGRRRGGSGRGAAVAGCH